MNNAALHAAAEENDIKHIRKLSNDKGFNVET